MKKILLLAVLIITVISSASAQYKKGDIELEGEVMWQVEDGYHMYKLAPSIKVFLNNRWAVDAGIALFGNSDKTRFGISAGANYYLPVTKKLYFAPRGGFDVEFTESNWSLNIKPSLVYELTEHLSMSLGIGYLGVGQFNDSDNIRFKLGICDNLSWGIAYKF